VQSGSWLIFDQGTSWMHVRSICGWTNQLARWALLLLYLPFFFFFFFLLLLLLDIWCKSKYHLDALFLTHVYPGSKFCPSVLETVGLWVPPRYIREFSVLSVRSFSTNFPSPRCASAANAVCRDVNVFRTKTVSLNQF
jgi:hypothetical protein